MGTTLHVSALKKFKAQNAVLSYCNRWLKHLGYRMVLLVLTMMVVQISSVRGQGGDPAGIRNLADKQMLPSGLGLAAKYPGDQGIGDDKAVVFVDDFQESDYKTRWRDVRDTEGQVLSLVKLNHPVLGPENQALQVASNLKRNTGGGLTTWFESSPRVFIRFYVRFDSDCDYVHHFCTLRGNRALTGGDSWSGFGGAGLRPQGDERFSTAIEPFGDWGKLPPPGQWNFYSYWYEMEPSPDGKFWGNAFRPAQQPNIKRDEWICVEMMLEHNTPGKSDGGQAWWINGELIGHWQDIPWRKSADLWANAFTLESYVTDRWTKQETNTVWFDQVVIATDYIGPVNSEKKDAPPKSDGN